MKLRKVLILKGGGPGAPLDPPLVADTVAGCGRGAAPLSFLPGSATVNASVGSVGSYTFASSASEFCRCYQKRYLILPNLSVADPTAE